MRGKDHQGDPEKSDNRALPRERKGVCRNQSVRDLVPRCSHVQREELRVPEAQAWTEAAEAVESLNLLKSDSSL